VNHPHFFIHVLVRWLEFVALVVLVGGLVYWNFVASVVRRKVPGFNPPSFDRWNLTAALMLGAAALVDMVFRSLMISGRPLGQLGSVLPTVLLKTHFGRVWIGLLSLIVLLSGFLLLHRMKKGGSFLERLIPLAASLGICLTLSLAGHAADLGNFRLTVLTDWIHLAAISSWVGGLFALRLHFSKVLAPLEEKTRIRSLRTGIEQFTKVAVTSVVALTVGGLYNTYVHVHSPALLAGTSYGKILVVKWLMVLPMLGLGGLSRYGILPMLQYLDGTTRKGFLARWAASVIKAWVPTPGPKNLEKLFFRLITIEALLGLGVLACSAWITQLAPPHESTFGAEHDHHEMHEM